MVSVYKPGRSIKISGFGAAAGAIRLDNAALIERYSIKITGQEMLQKTGIQCRYFLDEKQSLSDIAAMAAREALAKAQVDITSIDRIIVATSTGDCLSPSTAAIMQHKLGGRNIPCHDVSAACSGFLYALDQAVRYLETSDKTVLVVGADARSRTLNFDDARTAGLYGDGAGAFVLTTDKQHEGFKISASCLYADTAGHDAVVVPSVGSSDFSGKLHLEMPNGRLVMKSALRSTPEIVRNLMDSLNIDMSGVESFIFHQPNYNLLSAISGRMGLSSKQVPCIFPEFGNTVAASIPMTFCHAFNNGFFQAGDTLMLAAIGAGFTGGGVVIN